MKEDKLEELLDGNVDEVRSAIRDEEDLDHQKLKELEKDGKDRKTIKKFLDKRIDEEESEEEDPSTEEDEQDQSEEDESEEEASDDEEEDEANTSEDAEEESEEEDSEDEDDDSASGKAAKLQGPLDDLESVGDIRGAAVVRRDGLLIASNMSQDINDDQVGAMTASIVGSGETASQSLKMGDVDEVTVESNEGLLIATGAGDQGILAVLADPDVNMGLIKVEIENAIDKVKKVL